MFTRYYAMGVTYYEIWNEWNQDFWRVDNPDPATYATLLQAAYTTAKAVSPNITILIGGMSTGGKNGQTCAQQLQVVYNTIGTGYFDIMNFHPYAWTQATLTNGNSEIASIYSTMVANGDGAKRWWLTEYGVFTGTSTSVGSGDQNGAFTEAQQAQNLVEIIQLTRGLAYVDKLFFYEYMDDNNQPTNAESNYGLVRFDSSHKPSWSAVRNAISPQKTAGIGSVGLSSSKLTVLQ
jgi:hypothetical protein